MPVTQPTSEALSDEELAQARRLAPVRPGTTRLLATLDQALARCEAAEARLAAIRAVVDEQAEDEGLWSLPLIEGTQPIMEAYLQQELRRLHAVVEGDSDG